MGVVAACFGEEGTIALPNRWHHEKKKLFRHNELTYEDITQEVKTWDQMGLQNGSSKWAMTPSRPPD